jgi:hypothetical protein
VGLPVVEGLGLTGSVGPAEAPEDHGLARRKRVERGAVRDAELGEDGRPFRPGLYPFVQGRRYFKAPQEEGTPPEAPFLAGYGAETVAPSPAAEIVKVPRAALMA